MLIVAALAALIGTACESATPIPDEASQNNAFAAAAPTVTSEATVTPEHTQTPTPTTVVPTATPDLLNPPAPQPCPPGEIPVPITVRDGIVYMPDPPCIRLTTPTPLPYPRLQGKLNEIVAALERGAYPENAASLSESSSGDRVGVYIYIQRDRRGLKEFVIWLVDNGAEVGFAYNTHLVDDEWAARNGTTIEEEYATILLSEYIRGEAELELPYPSGEIGYPGAKMDFLGEVSIGAAVPVSLLNSIAQQPGFIRMIDIGSLQKPSPD